MRGFQHANQARLHNAERARQRWRESEEGGGQGPHAGTARRGEERLAAVLGIVVVGALTRPHTGRDLVADRMSRRRPSKPTRPARVTRHA